MLAATPAAQPSALATIVLRLIWKSWSKSLSYFSLLVMFYELLHVPGDVSDVSEASAENVCDNHEDNDDQTVFDNTLLLHK